MWDQDKEKRGLIGQSGYGGSGCRWAASGESRCKDPVVEGTKEFRKLNGIGGGLRREHGRREGWGFVSYVSLFHLIKKILKIRLYSVEISILISKLISNCYLIHIYLASIFIVIILDASKRKREMRKWIRALVKKKKIGFVDLYLKTPWLTRMSKEWDFLINLVFIAVNWGLKIKLFCLNPFRKSLKIISAPFLPF